MAKLARRDSDGNEIRSKYASNADKYKFQFEGFIRSDMEKADREACKNFQPTADDLDNWLVRRTEAGFTVKVGLKSGGDGMVASLMCANSEHDYSGWILSAFSDTWNDALRILMYKDTVMFAAGWELGMGGQKRASWG